MNQDSENKTKLPQAWLLDTPKKIYWSRVAFSTLYFVAAIVGFVWFWYGEMFYFKHLDSYHFDRYLWCLFSSTFGFSCIAFYHRNSDESPLPEYISYYLPLLFVISALVFSILHLFEASSGFVFYYFSFSACFILAFLVDSFWSSVLSIFGKVAQKFS